MWIASQELLGSREELLRKLDGFTSANLNVVYVDAWFRGYLGYPGSKYVPQFPGLGGRDYLEWLVPEIQKRGMRADLWFSYGFYAYHTADATRDPSMGPLLDKYPELVAVDREGNKCLHNKQWGDYYSLCPSNPKSHQVLAAMMVEMMTRYPANGLHLDRIRYPSLDFCYCSYCRQQFTKDTGMPLGGNGDGEFEQKFLQWRREQTAKAVDCFAKSLAAARPGAMLSAYVVGPAEMDSKAQGWDLWVKRDLVSFVAVSMYGSEIEQPMRSALQLLDGRNDKLAAAVSCGHASPVYLRNIELSRKFQPVGQITWYSGDMIDDIAGLRNGPYGRTAAWPFASGVTPAVGADADVDPRQ